MPELPETETIARDLNGAISGATIENVRVTRPDVLREVSARELSRRVKGARIERSWRRAKLIVIDLSTADRILIQPRFTGALIVDDGSLDRTLLDYSTLRFTLNDGRVLHYCDVRRLGTVALMNESRFAEYTGELGREPLDPFDGSAEDCGDRKHLRQRGALARSSRSVARGTIADDR